VIRQTFVLFDGVGRSTEERLWQDDVTSWSQFRKRESVPGIGDKRKKRLDRSVERAEKNLDRRNKAFFSYQLPQKQHWRLKDAFSDSIAYVDIETTGLNRQRDEITTVGIYDGNDARALVKGRDLTEDRLKEELSSYNLLVTFNGKRFDIPFIKEKFPCVDIEHPHIDLMYECKKIGLSGGLKSIEKEIGINRGNLDGVDGSDALRLWREHQRGSSEALERLVKYNKKDVRNMEPLLEHVTDRLYRKTFRIP